MVNALIFQGENVTGDNCVDIPHRVGLLELPEEELGLLLEGGMLSLQMGRFDEADTIFQGVGAIFPELSLPKEFLGHVAFAKKNFRLARKHFSEVEKLRPDEVGASVHRLECEIQLGLSSDVQAELAQLASRSDAKDYSYVKPLLDALREAQEVNALSSH